MDPITVVLYDIDGTLLRSGGAGRGAMQRAAHELFGVDDMFESLSFAGAVDSQIVRHAMATHGVPPTGRNVGLLRHRYVRRLIRSLEHPVGGVCPGAEASVHAVRKTAKVGLLTGNWKEGARAKLHGFGLGELFEGCVGAYGGDGMHRNELVPVAVRRAIRRWGRVDRVVVIGDTVADVACARAGAEALPGTEVVAVAVETGFATIDDLRASKPDLLLVDLDKGLPELLSVC